MSSAHRLSDEQQISVILDAIAEAERSVAEDDAPRPSVGALLVDDQGRVVLRAHRGEEEGLHAEQVLLRKAAVAGLRPEGGRRAPRP